MHSAVEYVATFNFAVNLLTNPLVLTISTLKSVSAKKHNKKQLVQQSTPLRVSFENTKIHRRKRQTERPSRVRGNTESFYRPETNIQEYVDEEYEYEWDDEDPEYLDYENSLKTSPNLRFDIETGNEWSNTGQNYEEFSNGDTDTCTEFKLCSNTVSPNGGNCLFMSTNFFCEGCNPIDLTCQLRKHVTIRAYHPTQKRLLWVYNSTSKHVMGFKKVEECMTVLAVNAEDFPGGGMDPCAEVYGGDLEFYSENGKYEVHFLAKKNESASRFFFSIRFFFKKT